VTERPARDVASLLSAGGFIVVGVLALYYTRDMTPLGSVFPRTIASAMIIFSVIYIVWRFFKSHVGVEPPAPGSIPRRLLLVAVMVAWALLLNRIGFLVTSVVAALALLLVANWDRWTPRRAIVYALSTLALVVGLYAVFAFGLKVPLPTGALI
jgi:hypothetical protein